MNTAISAASADNNFLYLNRDKRWADFALCGLEIGSDGDVRMAALPAADSSAASYPIATSLVAIRAGMRGIAGIAALPGGTLLWTDPQHHRILRKYGCDDVVAPLDCVGGPGQLCRPRGLLWHRRRNAIFVADTGNGRVQIFDAGTNQLTGIWDGRGGNPDADPFRAPVTVDCDADGNVYVLDYRARRVVRFDIRGNIISSFWQNIQAGPSHPMRPARVAISASSPAEIFILDIRPSGNGHPSAIFVYDADGHFLRSAPLAIKNPGAIAVDDDRLYIADNDRLCLSVFPREFPNGTLTAFGDAVANPLQITAICFSADGSGDLLINSGSGGAPKLLTADGAFIKKGWMAGGPFLNPSLRSEQWHRLKVMLDTIAAGTHVQIFVQTSRRGGASILPAPPLDPAQPPFGNAGWIPVPSGVPEYLFAGAPDQDVWVGIQFTGEGAATPVVRQMLLEFDHQTYINQLPAVFSKDESGREVLIRLLSLLDGAFEDVEDLIRHLPAWFDPAATPPDFLKWLSGWVALEHRDDWGEAKQRAAISEAYALYAQRGTPGGVLAALKFFLGVNAVIDEPILHANIWTLPYDDDNCTCASCGASAALPPGVSPSLLGISTTLACAEPQGAVLGSAALGQSQIASDDDYGTPLFSRLANRFTVRLYRGAGADRLDAVRALLETEKPAHVLSHACVIEPILRVGFQARIGIDTIVGNSSERRAPSRLGQPGHGDRGGLVLGGDSAAIGESASVGQTIRLRGD